MSRPESNRSIPHNKLSKIKAKIAEFQKERENLKSPATSVRFPIQAQDSVTTLGSVMTDNSYKVLNNITDVTRGIIHNYTTSTAQLDNGNQIQFLSKGNENPSRHLAPGFKDLNDDLDDYSLDLSDHSPVLERVRKEAHNNPHNRKSSKQKVRPSSSKNVVITVSQPQIISDVHAMSLDENELISINSLDESAENTATIISSEVAGNSFCAPLSHRHPAVDWTRDLNLLKPTTDHRSSANSAGKGTLDEYVKKILYGEEAKDRVEEELKFGARGEFSLELTAKKAKFFTKDEIPFSTAKNRVPVYRLK